VLIAGGSGASGRLTSLEIFDPTSRTFSAPGNLQHARQDHTATLLSDGRVLIAGGADSSGPLRSAEIFNPVCGELLISPESAIRHTHAGDALLRLANAGNFEANSSGDLCANIYVYDDVQEQVTDKNGA